MKKLWPLLFCIVLFTDCKKDEDILFTMQYTDQFVIPAGINPFDVHYFRLENIPVGNYFSDNNVTANDMEAINPQEAQINAIFSGISDYDFIRDISIRMYTEDENNFKEIFFRDEVPLNAGENVGIIPTLVDVRPLLQNTRFNLLVRLELRTPPQSTLETRLNFSFNAK